jgi:hypothetical protein
MRAFTKPPYGVHLPRHMTWDQVREDTSVPIVMTNTRHMAKSIAAQGRVAWVVAGVGEDELAEWLKRRGAEPVILPKGGLPM